MTKFLKLFAIATGYELAMWVHHADPHWGWYGDPKLHGDDPLALVIGVMCVVVLWKLINRAWKVGE